MPQISNLLAADQPKMSCRNGIALLLNFISSSEIVVILRELENLNLFSSLVERSELAIKSVSDIEVLKINLDLLIAILGKYDELEESVQDNLTCLLYTSPSPRDATLSRMPSSA